MTPTPISAPAERWCCPISPMAAATCGIWPSGAGKDGHIYVVNRDAMGKFNAGSNNIYQELTGVLGGGVFSMPAYFNGTLYYGAVGDAIKAFKITNAMLATGPASQTSNTFPLSGSDSQHFGERHQQRHRVGGRKHNSGGAARLRRQQPA